MNEIPFEAHTVVLACTHYPVLMPSLARSRPSTQWLDCCELTALAAERLLGTGLGFRTASATGTLQLLLPDLTPEGKAMGERFLGESLEAVTLTALV